MKAPAANSADATAKSVPTMRCWPQPYAPAAAATSHPTAAAPVPMSPCIRPKLLLLLLLLPIGTSTPVVTFMERLAGGLQNAGAVVGGPLGKPRNGGRVSSTMPATDSSTPARPLAPRGSRMSAQAATAVTAGLRKKRVTWMGGAEVGWQHSGAGWAWAREGRGGVRGRDGGAWRELRQAATEATGAQN